jgi:hypothetical protein
MLTELLAVVLWMIVLGLTAGELAALVRVGSESSPLLKRIWSWDSKGRPRTCAVCLGAWMSALTFLGAAFLLYVCGFHDLRALLLAFAGVPGAAAIAAIVQRLVIIEEFVLPESEPPVAPSTSVTEALLVAVEAGREVEPARTCGNCVGPEHFEDGPSNHRYCRRFGQWLPGDVLCAAGKRSAR